MFMEHNMTLNEKIVNVLTGEETIRPYTAEEIAEVEAERVKIAARQKELQDREIARALILEKLGLTEDEAKLLLS
jgi:hypothetical protein